MSEQIIVYFDYLCPFAWRGAEMAEMVTSELDVAFEWRHFSLYQSNYGGGENWQLWNDKIHPDDETGGKGLLPFLASCAARKQGREAYEHFRLELLRARHRDHRPLTLDSVLQVAKAVCLHFPTFESDFTDPECRTTLAHEHFHAQGQGVFGTPTFHFPSGHLAYFRIQELPRGQQEAVDLFSDYRRLLERYPYLQTIKRPRPKEN